ncbi:MAG: glycoside hydrolase family 28 protein [Oscillospiraceae bacterium]|nr:glycoside hydrolase family 28 protein [Oscillospiraceae bacterium]
MLNTLFLSPTSACFELKNDAPYFAPEHYVYALDGQELGESSVNVLSLFGLTPGSAHSLRLRFSGGGETSVSFRLPKETCALDVRGFGARGDGLADDTSALRAAIAVLPEGGRLFFPPGVYRTLPLFLKSHIHLDFAAGAALLASPERDQYPVLPGTLPDLEGGEELHFGAFEGQAKPMYASLLTAQYARDITVTGPGILDGNGEIFWKDFFELPAARPRLMFFNRCRGIRVHGVRARNSPSWQIHPYYSEDLGFYDLSVEAPKNSPNTDAMDPESCDRVEIVGCRFNVGDDCVAIKSGKIELGSTLNRPALRYTIRNCLMEAGHGAVTLGSEIGAGVKELTVSQCCFRGTDRGLRIKTRRGWGQNCRVDGVTFENICMDGVLTPITMNMWYNCCDPDRESEYVWSREALPVDERTPSLGRFRFRNIRCTNAHAAALYVDGLPEMPVEEVALENVRISFAQDAKSAVPIMKNFASPCRKLGLYFDNVKRVVLRNVTVHGAEGSPLLANHCGEVVTEGFHSEE